MKNKKGVTGAQIDCIAYGNGKFIAGSQNDLLTSTNQGNTWTKKTAPTTSFLYGAACHEKVWIILGNAGNIIVSQDNGNTWEKKDLKSHDVLRDALMERIFG
ncbi:MAG: hypothetical protein ACTTJ1_03415 [Treponema sp.]